MTTELLDGTATAEYWAAQITAHVTKTVEAILATGQVLIAAKKKLARGEWLRMFEARLVPFGERHAQFLMNIAKQPILSNPNHGSDLPPSWSLLRELARFPDDFLEAAIADGRVSASISRSAIRRLLETVPARRAGARAAAPVSGDAPAPRVTTKAAFAARMKTIRELAAEGLSSWQIAHRVHIGAGHCRNLMREHGITCHGDRATRNARRVNPNRILDGIVEALVDAPTDLAMIDIRTVDRAQIPRWLDALAESQRAVARLVSQLRKLGNNSHEEDRHDDQSKAHSESVENSARADQLDGRTRGVH